VVAIVGVSSGAPDSGVEVTTCQSRLVTLGTMSAYGQSIPETTLKLSVVDGVVSTFDKEPSYAKGPVHGFSILTSTYDNQIARDSGFTSPWFLISNMYTDAPYRPPNGRLRICRVRR